jgi:DNA repair protein RecN (Recombination protein N)
MQAATRVREDVVRAAQALGHEGAEGQVSDAARWLDDAAGALDDAFDPALAALGRVQVELAEAQSAVDRALDGLDVDPYELERTEERLFALRGLARKHSVAPDELATLADDLRARLALVDGGAETMARAEAALAEADDAHAAAAARLHDVRAGAAGRLDVAMAAELAPLKMERAVFATVLRPAQPGPDGVDEVEFTVATNPGAPPGPLGRIASGGELSRFLLALKVCLTRDAAGLTLIFDEIDRGVGGATADAVGRRLSALSNDAQVLVVTHSPQVAALGAHHWRVEKRVEAEMTTSTVVPLAPADRVDEIARMLAGDTITEAARAAANALLDTDR